jgi:hypothetical protein
LSVRAVSFAVGRAGAALVGAGFLLIMIAEFLPVLQNPPPPIMRGEPGFLQWENMLVLHREGLVLFALAGASVALIGFWGGTLGARMACSFAIIVAGLGASGYASSRVAEEVVNPCVVRSCHSWPQNAGLPRSVGIAFDAAAIGGQLVALGGLVLLFGGIRRAPLFGHRPERTHPVWM